MIEEPFADQTYYLAGKFGGENPDIEALLARASRIVRGEVPDIDQRIADGLDSRLVADVVCDMVAYALASPGGVGIDSLQQGAGPYQATVKYVNPVGQLSFTKVHRKRLGIVSGRAWEIDLLAGRR